MSGHYYYKALMALLLVVAGISFLVDKAALKQGNANLDSEEQEAAISQVVGDFEIFWPLQQKETKDISQFPGDEYERYHATLEALAASPNTLLATPPSHGSNKKYSDYKLAVMTICCPPQPGQPDAYRPAQRLNARYFQRHGIPFYIFHQCMGLYDYERIWRITQLFRDYHYDFVVWLDCDAVVVTGTKDDPVVDPWDRFLAPFDLFHPNVTQREAIGMVLSTHMDHFNAWQDADPITGCNETTDGDCGINIGAFVARNNPAGVKVLKRIEQVMTATNSTSVVPDWRGFDYQPGGGCPPWMQQKAFDYLFHEQRYLHGTIDAPVRKVHSEVFNKHVPPLGCDHISPRKWRKWYQGNTGWSRLPLFVLHPWGQKNRAQFWSCVEQLPEPRSSADALDACAMFFRHPSSSLWRRFWGN